MEEKTPKKPNETIPLENSLEDIKLLYDFEMKVVSESINILVKGLPIYGTILAALLVYFISRDYSIAIKRYIVIIEIIASINTMIIYYFLTKAILKGVHSIENTLKTNNIDLFRKLQIDQFIAKMKKSISLSLLLSLIYILIIAIGLVIYLGM